MALVTSHTESVILTNGLPSTTASPGSYFGFGLNATKSGSTGPRLQTGTGNPNGVTTSPLGSLWIDNTSLAGAYFINTNGATEWFSIALNYNSTINTIVDPGNGGAIAVDFSGTCNLTVAAGVAETRTLAAATLSGQTLRLNLNVLGAGGTIAITCATGLNAAGNTVMTFNAARDSIELVGVLVAGSLRWQIGWNNSVALS